MSETSKYPVTEYSDELAARICTAITEGASLVGALRDEGVATFRFYKWLDSEPGLRENYARAREQRGEHYGGKVAEIAQRVEGGELDPQAARVAMDGYKWTAARMAPKNWGDRALHEVTGAGGGPIETSLRVVFEDTPSADMPEGE